MDEFTANDFDENGNLISMSTEVDNEVENESDNEVNVNINVNTETGAPEGDDGGGGNGGSEKVEICHDGNTIEVDASALPAHYEHGDTLGPCGDEAESVVTVDPESEVTEELDE